MCVCANFVYYFKTIIFFAIEAKLTFEPSIRNFDLASLFFAKRKTHYTLLCGWSAREAKINTWPRLFFAKRRIILCYVEAKINTELAEF